MQQVHIQVLGERYCGAVLRVSRNGHSWPGKHGDNIALVSCFDRVQLQCDMEREVFGKDMRAIFLWYCMGWVLEVYGTCRLVLLLGKATGRSSSALSGPKRRYFAAAILSNTLQYPSIQCKVVCAEIEVLGL